VIIVAIDSRIGTALLRWSRAPRARGQAGERPGRSGSTPCSERRSSRRSMQPRRRRSRRGPRPAATTDPMCRRGAHSSRTRALTARGRVNWLGTGVPSVSVLPVLRSRPQAGDIAPDPWYAIPADIGVSEARDPVRGERSVPRLTPSSESRAPGRVRQSWRGPGGPGPRWMRPMERDDVVFVGAALEAMFCVSTPSTWGTGTAIMWRACSPAWWGDRGP
jgi:hypothetical protein